MCHYHLSGISDGNTVDRAAARANSSEMKDQGLTHPEPHSFSSLLFQSSVPGLCTFSSRNFQHLGWLVKHKPLAVEETTQFILSYLPPLRLLRSSQLPQWGSEQPVGEAQGISWVCRTNQVEGMLLKLPMGFPIRMVCQHPKTLHAHVLGHDNPCLRKDVHPMISLWMHFDLAGYLPPWGISQCMGFGPCFSSCWIAGDIKTISKTAASATLAHGEKPFTCLTASDRTGYVLVLFRALIEIMSSVFFPFFDI